MKYLLLLDTPFWMIISGVLTTYVFRLRQRIAGLNDPRLWLSRGERRALARQDIADQKYQRNIDFIDGK